MRATYLCMMLAVLACGHKTALALTMEPEADIHARPASDDTVRTSAAAPGKPLIRATTSLFSGSGQCAACHRMIVSQDGGEVTIDADWRSAMMANAARDPLYLATVEDETAHFPQLSATIQQTCARCHMPMAHVQAGADGAPIEIFDKGFLHTDHPLHHLAVDGVSCTMCHQIQSANLGQKKRFSGGFQVDLTTRKPDRAAYGPHEDLDQRMMRMFDFTPVHGAHMDDSALCAVCHTLYTPTVGDSGEIVGMFPEQTAFLEWRHSSHAGQGRSCRSCHMPKTTRRVVKATGRSRVPAEVPYHQHHFVGGNTFMLKLLRENVDRLGLTASTQHLADTIERAVVQLRGGATLAMAQATKTGSELVFTVKVDSAAGHKFPTGFPSRRLWLHTTVADESGKVLFESGAVRPDGSIVGNDADADAAKVEPHHETITCEDQVQIYESILADGRAVPTYVLLRAAGYAKDNRLLPAGFDKATAGADFAVRGVAERDEDFVGGSDQVTYRINLTGHETKALTVHVRLLFQSVSFRYAAEVLRSKGPKVGQFRSLHESADRGPVEVAVLTVPVR